MAEDLRYGLGFRSKHYARVVEGPAATADFFEIITENFMTAGGRPRRFLDQLAERYPVVAHGVSLSIAGPQPLDETYLAALKKMVGWLKPRLVSDHLCWTGEAQRNAHDLLPVPFTEKALAHVAARVRHVQDVMDRRLHLENPSGYVAFAGDDMDEATFLAELCRRTGCGLLLDVNNLFVNTMNLGYEPLGYLETLPPDAVGYFHLAGHAVAPGVRIDTHDDHVVDEVWALYRVAARRFPGAATLVEWDDKLPEYDELDAELALARDHREAALARPYAELRTAAAACLAGAPAPAPAVPRRTGAGSLAATQTMFLDLVTQAANVAAADDRLGLLDAQRPVPALTGMNVYNNAFFVRIRDILRDELPTLHALVPVVTAGREEAPDFDQIVMRYLGRYPSDSFDITFAARRLPLYLTELALPELAAAAALELARFELFAAPDGGSPLTVEALVGRSDDAWADARFPMRPAVRLVSVTHDVTAAWTDVDHGETPAAPAAGRTEYLVYRHDEDVYHEALAPAAARLFAALAAGRTFAEACQAFSGPETDLAGDEAAVMAAAAELARWTALGLLAAPAAAAQAPA